MERLRQMDDAELAHLAISSGCEDAFATLFHRYSPALRQFISRKLGVRYNLTDDIAMEAWADAYKGLAEFRGESSFRTWIYSIALNRIKERLRALSAKKRRVPENYDPPRYVRDTEERIHLRMELDRVISELPPKAARVLIAKELIGYSHEEIADRMGVTVGTTKSQLHRGKELARSALRKGAGK
jgi:RNA polymerase sigma-70 factor (ECF subfamily)